MVDWGQFSPATDPIIILDSVNGLYYEVVLVAGVIGLSPVAATTLTNWVVTDLVNGNNYRLESNAGIFGLALTGDVASGNLFLTDSVNGLVYKLTSTAGLPGTQRVCTAVVGRRTITVMLDGGADFDVSDFIDSGGSRQRFPRGLRLSAIDFYPSAGSDKVVVREKSAVGAVIWPRADIAGGGIHKATGGRSLRMWPYVKISEQNLATPANAMLILEMD